MREHELRDVLRAANKGHHIVVKGRSGIGKTSLLELVVESVELENDRLALKLQPISVR